MLKTVSSVTNAIGALNYKGTWNASTNTPTLVSSVGVKGDYYQVSVAGSTTINGISNWGVGDVIAFNGTTWQRIEGGADLNGVNLSVSGTTTLSGLTASTALALNAGKDVVSVTNTGTGDNVLATSPTLVTPTLGVAAATSINKVALTAPATGSTLTIADGKTLTANQSLTLAGTDATTMTFPTTSATIARTDAGQTFTGDQIFSDDVLVGTTTKRAGVTSAKTNFLGQAALGARNTTNGGAYLTTGVWDEAATTHTIAFGSYSIDDNASGMIVVSASNKSTFKAGTLILAFGKAFGTASVSLSTIATLLGGITTLTAAASGGDIVITTDSDCSITYAVIGGF